MLNTHCSIAPSSSRSDGIVAFESYCLGSETRKHALELDTHGPLSPAAAEHFAHPRRQAASLTGASLSVSPGERLCLVGRNASGKSTLLKSRRALVEPDGGTRFLQPGATCALFAAGAGSFRPYHHLAYVEAGLGPTDDPHPGHVRSSTNSGLTGEEDPHTFRAARRAAPRSPACSRPSPIFCSSTSRPTISICRHRMARSEAAKRSAPRSSIISHDRQFLAKPFARHGVARSRPHPRPRARLC